MYKSVWNWWKEAKDISETAALAVGGIGAVTLIVMVVVLAFFGAMRDLSLAWQIVLVVAIFTLGLVLLRGLWKTVPHINARWNPFWRQSEIALERPLPNWIQAIVDRDKSDPADKAFVYRLTINWKLMERDGSYRFNLLIDVFNGAVYDLTIGTKVEGTINFEQAHLSPSPTIRQSNPAGIIPHANQGSLELDQDITVMEPIVKRLRDKEGQQVRFDLESLIIWAEYREPGGGVVAEFPLKLGPGVLTPLIAFIK